MPESTTVYLSYDSTTPHTRLQLELAVAITALCQYQLDLCEVIERTRLLSLIVTAFPALPGLPSL